MKKVVLSFVVGLFAYMSAFGQVDTINFVKNIPPLEIDGEIVSAELAKKHIQNGKIFLLTGGLSYPHIFLGCDTIAEQNLGMKFKPMFGCHGSLDWVTQTEAYNAVVLETLQIRYFGEFEKLFKAEVKKCYQERAFLIIKE